MTQYTIRNLGEMQQPSQTEEFCLQCKKVILPISGFPLEVTKESGIVGYLHPHGTCKTEWENAHPS